MEQNRELPYEDLGCDRNGFRESMRLRSRCQAEEFELQMIRHCSELELLMLRCEGDVMVYDIQGMQTFSALFADRNSDSALVWNVLSEIVDILQEMEEYLLSEDSVLLEPDKIFLDPGQDGVKLCYLPGYNGNIRSQFSALVEYIMKRIDHREDHLVVLVYGMYHLVREPRYSLDSVKKLLLEHRQLCLQEQEETPVQSDQSVQQAQWDQPTQSVQPESMVWKEHISKEPKTPEASASEAVLRREEIQRQQQLKELLRLRRGRILFGTAAVLCLIAAFYFYQGALAIPAGEKELAQLICLVGAVSSGIALAWQQYKLMRLCEKIDFAK